MLRVTLALIAVGLIASTVGHAQAAPYDRNRWRLTKQREVRLIEDSAPAQVLLLKSRNPTGTGGAEQPMNDVELLVLLNGRVIYQHTKRVAASRDRKGNRFYMDDYLEIRDVTVDGEPEILFHSGIEGASDSATQEHILYYDKKTADMADISLPAFYRSGTHGLRWLNTAGAPAVVIGDRDWPASTPLEDRCHYCDSPFKYTVYRWDSKRGGFRESQRLQGTRAYEEASTAMDGDWDMIRRGAGAQR